MYKYISKSMLAFRYLFLLHEHIFWIWILCTNYLLNMDNHPAPKKICKWVHAWGRGSIWMCLDTAAPARDGGRAVEGQDQTQGVLLFSSSWVCLCFPFTALNNPAF